MTCRASDPLREHIQNSVTLRIVDCGLRTGRKIRNPQSAIRNRFVRSTIWIILLASLLSAIAVSLNAEEIDRLLCAVNGKVITEGDVQLARNLNAVLSLGENKASPSKSEEIDRLIDLELMRQELAAFPGVPGERGTVQARLEELKQAYAEEGGLTALLQRLGLQESELLEYIRLQDSILHFVDFRFRPFASVSDQEIQEYYQEKLVPPLRQAQAPIPALAEVSAKIAEIVKEEKVNTLMSQWVQDIRRHSRIEYFLNGEEPPWESKR